MIQVADNCFQLRGRVVHIHILRDDSGLTLIDGGFLSLTPDKVEAAIHHLGHEITDVDSILLSHGHIDHTLHLEELRQRSGAKLYAPRADKAHIEGRYSYQGLSRVCGALEAITRKVFRYKIPSVDVWFSPDERLPVRGGIKVIPLPGHTFGHCGFYLADRELLFASDLFSNFYGFPKLPPPWFNVDRSQIEESIRRADALPLEGGVLLSHCHAGTPAGHRRDLKILARRNP